MTQVITGRVYKLVNEQDPTQFYIGSTIKPLQCRLSCHRHRAAHINPTSMSKSRRAGRRNKLYLQMSESPFTIELLEEVACASLTELRQIEQSYLNRLTPPLNVNRAFSTDTETRLTKAIADARWAQANQNKYCCNSCGYRTYHKSNWRKHELSTKHCRTLIVNA